MIMKFLGIDYGESKVGLAIADEEVNMALPFKILANKGWDSLFSDLADIIKAEDIGTIVVGVPLSGINPLVPSITMSPQEEKVRKFFAELKDRFTDLTIVMHDERFSSQEAQKLGAGKRDDDVAAMLMLQNYLDSNS